jgi:hypothetical protein
MQQEVVGAACIVFVDLAPVALGDAAQMLRLPVAIFVERRKAVIPIKTIRAADPPGLKIERGSIPIASWSRMDLGVAAEEMERLSDNLPKREVFCGFSDPFSGLCVSHACIPGKQEREPSECPASDPVLPLRRGHRVRWRLARIEPSVAALEPKVG